MDVMDEEEQLQRALALSLEESQTQREERREDEDEDEQFQRYLQAAIEASKTTGSSSAPRDTQARTRDAASERRPEREGPVMEGENEREKEKEREQETRSEGFVSERARMEKERLERLKRAREANVASTNTSTSGVAITPPTKKQRLSPAPSPPSSQTRKSSATAGPSQQKTNGKEKEKKNGNGEAELELFWDGELRQIANRLVDADKDDRPTFRLSEIIGPKSEVTLAILSSYANNVEWLYGFFEPSTPVVVVNQPGEDGDSGLKELAPNMLMTKPFIRNGRGCMHIKLMLLFYRDGRLRVVVPTANMIEYDWRDIENTAWVQDVPIRETTIRHDPKASDFPGTLQRVLQTLHVPAALTKFLDGEFPELPIETPSELRMRWDWSRVKAKLVASIAGKHDGWEQVGRTGHPALMKAVQELGARPPKGKQLVLECQGSSIGTYSTQWMNEFHCSARGESATIWLDRPRSQRAKLPWPAVKILFPSLHTVANSRLGMPGGGTMFCRKTQWEAKNFPRELFYDSNSKRGRVLMHSKMIVGTFKEGISALGRTTKGRQREEEEPQGLSGGEEFKDNEDDDDVLVTEPAEKKRTKERVIGWAYVGSHNFTPSAWGTLSGSSSNPSLNIVNYELGIVIPLRTYEELEKVACWKRPARKYVEGVDRPWMQEEMREGLTTVQD